MSYGNRGIPDVSYHGENAWKVPCEVSSRQLGVFYNGEDPDTGEEEHLFIAYNMHWLEHTFALPALPKGKKWYPGCFYLRKGSCRKGSRQKIRASQR